VTIKDAVYAVMPQAYMDASDGGRLPAPARQIAYACRRLTGLGDKLQIDYVLKGQGGGLLTLYLAEHPDTTADWDVARDARGTFVEPHTNTSVPLGTLAVRAYLDGRPYWASSYSPPQFALDFPTHGPENRFDAILYVEKEGFAEQLAAARVQERWDIAVASCKGYSVHAARRLVRALHDRYDVPILVAHDFDKAGIGIFDTLGNVGDFVDIGVRLDDVHDERWGLAAMSEPVTYGKEGKTDPRPNLTRRGATADEVRYLCETDHVPFHGRRVELNALVGRTFIEWLEHKLEAHGVTKVIPDEQTVERAYRRAFELETINRAIRAAHRDAAERAARVTIPADLLTQVENSLDMHPELPWDDVVAAIAEAQAGTDIDGQGDEI
jgi:hypothetical protein